MSKQFIAQVTRYPLKVQQGLYRMMDAKLVPPELKEWYDEMDKIRQAELALRKQKLDLSWMLTKIDPKKSQEILDEVLCPCCMQMIDPAISYKYDKIH